MSYSPLIIFSKSINNSYDFTCDANDREDAIETILDFNIKSLTKEYESRFKSNVQEIKTITGKEFNSEEDKKWLKNKLEDYISNSKKKWSFEIKINKNNHKFNFFWNTISNTLEKINNNYADIFFESLKNRNNYSEYTGFKEIPVNIDKNIREVYDNLIKTITNSSSVLAKNDKNTNKSNSSYSQMLLSKVIDDSLEIRDENNLNFFTSLSDKNNSNESSNYNDIYDITDIVFDAKNIVDDVLEVFKKDKNIKTSITLLVELKKKNKFKRFFSNEDEKIYDILINTFIIAFSGIEMIYKNIFEYQDQCTSAIIAYFTGNEPTMIPEIAERVELYHSAKKKDNDLGNRSTEADIMGLQFGKKQNRQMDSNGFVVNKEYSDNYKTKFDKVKRVTFQAAKMKLAKTRLFMDAGYFKKWYGAIPGMYQNYASQAVITENRMKGDPTRILSKYAPEYLMNVAKFTEQVMNDLMELAKKTSAQGAIQMKINTVKGYCNHFTIEDTMDPKEFGKRIKDETTYRLCRTIMPKAGIYGYTPESVVENGKFPTSNHIVVSLFVENPFEKPEDQHVSDIFASPESILAFGHPEKLRNLTDLYDKVITSIETNTNSQTVTKVMKAVDDNFKNYARAIKRQALNSDNVGGGNSPDSENMRLNIDITKHIKQGIEDSFELVIDHKTRCIQCCASMYSMISRISRLAKMTISALIDAAHSNADVRTNNEIANGVIGPKINSMKNQTNLAENAVKVIKPNFYL